MSAVIAVGLVGICMRVGTDRDEAQLRMATSD